MQVRLAYGKTGTPITLPDDGRTIVLEPRFAPALDDPGAAIQHAVAHPIGCQPLEQMARGKRSAAISVCDITRPVPNQIVLPEVTAALEAGGIPPDNIAILIATGLHREATPAELDEILGPDVLACHPVDSHRAKNLDEHAYLGETKGGTPVYIDKRFIDADLHITLGFIEPHLMAGFSGGRKLISIGLAGERTIKRLHSPMFMREERVSEGCFPDNPLHQEFLEIAAMARHDFMIDVALTEGRRIAGVFAGDPIEAHAQGVEFVRKSTLASVDEPADLVITTAGGYPLDLTFYQTVKGITAASHVVKPGGVILVVGDCSEGLGSPEFSDLMRKFPDWRELLDRLTGAPVAVDQWQAEKLAIAARKADLALCAPGLSVEDRKVFWGRVFDTPQEAVDRLIAELPRDARILVIPEGPYVFTQVERASALV